MLLELTRYRQPVNDFARTFTPEEVAGDGDAYRIVAPVDLAFEIHKDKDKFRLVGTVTTELELACSRCLEPFKLPVDREFDLRYLPAGAGEPESDDDAETEVEEDDVSITFYRDEQIDLNELLREQFYLALPMKPLCFDDCKGICPQCGTNRNTAPCDCNPHWEDPRLAGLKTLLEKRKHDDA